MKKGCRTNIGCFQKETKLILAGLEGSKINFDRVTAPEKVSVYPITKTYLYNFDLFKPYFYTVKLGFKGVYIIFIISAQNIDYGYSLEPPRRGGSNEYPQSMF